MTMQTLLPVQPSLHHSWYVLRFIFVGVDCLSILFNHRSFQKPDPFSLGFIEKSGSLDSEWNWKVPLEQLIPMGHCSRWFRYLAGFSEVVVQPV